jgi:biotin transporter BioY
MSSVPPDLPPQVFVKPPWFACLSRVQTMLISFIVAALVFFCGGALDWLVRNEYLHPMSLMLAGAAVASALGLLVLQTLTEVQIRYEVLVQGLQRIAELNHHIRNALQVIVYTNVPERSAEAIKQVNAAVSRIESVLHERVPASGPVRLAG